MKKVKNRTVTKKEVCDAIAEKLNLKQTDVKGVVQDLLDTMVEVLAEGHKIELREFGVFRVVEKRPRKGRNPRTKEMVYVPAKYTVKFKPGKVMRERVEKSDAEG